MSKLASPGVIAGLCAAAAAIATAYNAAPVAAFFNDPSTPTHIVALIVALIGVVGAVVAGILPNHSKPAA